MPTPPKRVLLMVSSMRGGGSERQVLLLCRELNRQRFQPHLYLTEAAGDFLCQVPDDVTVHSFDAAGPARGLYYPGKELRRQVRYLQKVIRDHRIEVIYDRTFHMTLIAASAAKGIPRVSTIVSPPEFAVPLVEKRFVELKRRRLAEAYRTSSAVVAVSRQAADSAIAYYRLNPYQIQVIPNPVDAEQLRRRAGQDGQVDLDGQVDPAVTRLVCVGRMTEEKGHTDLIEAVTSVIARWPDDRHPLQVDLVGDGPLRNPLERRVQERGLSDSVKFCGETQSAEKLIAEADALVLPSRFEGMPNVVLEAMALQTPVIATRAGGAVELQRDQETAFWAETENPESLAAAILAFARQPDEARRHVSSASELIAAHHGPQLIVSRIEDLLDPPHQG